MQYWLDATRQNAAGVYADVLGLSSVWRWLLHNQQGYRDGFQIESGPAQSTITVQYLAVASRLALRRVSEVTMR